MNSIFTTAELIGSRPDVTVKKSWNGNDNYFALGVSQMLIKSNVLTYDEYREDWITNDNQYYICSAALAEYIEISPDAKIRIIISTRYERGLKPFTLIRNEDGIQIEEHPGYLYTKFRYDLERILQERTEMTIFIGVEIL